MAVSKLRLKQTQGLQLMFAANINALTPQEIELRESLENSLYDFCKAAWKHVHPGFQYVDGWHIKVISEHLEAAYHGYIETLLINIPSRCMKSTICNIFFPAWVWAREPHLKFLNISSSGDLSERDALKCKQLIQSEWYQRLWGHKVQLLRELSRKERYGNTAGGEKFIKSIHSSSMGEGANFIMADDVNAQNDVMYATQREYVNLVLDATVGIRIDRISESRRGALIIIQQRLHQFDATGHFLAKNDPSIIHLMLPWEYDPKRHCRTIVLPGTKKVWSDPRKEKGELIWPNMYGENETRRRKSIYGTAINISAQMQQDPTPSGGNLIKEDWFRWWRQKGVPRCEYVIQSWDTALSIKEEACDSAVTNWGVFTDENNNPNLILLNSWSGKLENPDLRRMMVNCAHNYYTDDPDRPLRQGPKPTLILIEEAMNGVPLIQDLKLGGITNVIGFNPRTHGFKDGAGDSPTRKLARTKFASMIIESGIVWIPLAPESEFTRRYSYGDEFVEACLRCPRGKGQDLIDSMAQAFIWLSMRGIIHYPGENPDAIPIDFSNREILYEEPRSG